eukprot:825867-Pelagomonas_calceolata.AAC.5
MTTSQQQAGDRPLCKPAPTHGLMTTGGQVGLALDPSGRSWRLYVAALPPVWGLCWFYRFQSILACWQHTDTGDVYAGATLSYIKQHRTFMQLHYQDRQDR